MNKKEKKLKCYITDFAIEIGSMAEVENYNKAWEKLLKRIDKLKLFDKKRGCSNACKKSTASVA